MCGITGFVISNKSSIEVSNDSLEKMTRSLVHRGPDDEGYFYSKKVGLGSRRLKILDLSPAGNMPIYNEDNSIVVIQNGEIYNYQSLRKQLIKKGHKFRSNSDTEVIVHLYEELGSDFAKEIDGMYAIVILDKKLRKLILCRDRFGEKPLYFFIDQFRNLVFSSEIRAFYHYPYFNKDLNWLCLDQFLSIGYIFAPGTPFKNLHKLLPGHILTYNQVDGNYQMEKYWSLPTFSEGVRGKTEEEYLSEFEQLFIENIESRMVSDVPIGAFLSGGIDSSLIVANMAKLKQNKVQTFSIGSSEYEGFNENEYAQKVAEILGIKHTSMQVNKNDFLSAFERLPELLDEPLADIAVVSVYLITKFAKENGFTVMLSGDGGDELFLGYPIYSWAQKLGLFYSLPNGIQATIESSMDSIARLLKNNRFKNMATTLKMGNIVDALYYLAGFGSWTYKELTELKLEPIPDLHNHRFLDYFFNVGNNSQTLHCLENSLISTYLTDNNCNRMDKPSMYNSVEVRSPFLDPKLIEFARNMPLNMRFNKNGSKYILRKALKKYLHENIINRPKQGFNAIPIKHWLKQELFFLIDEYLNPSYIKKQGIFNSKKIDDVIKKHMAGNYNYSIKIWELLILQIWLKRWRVN